MSLSFGALGRLCFVTIAFPEYLHLYFSVYIVGRWKVFRFFRTLLALSTDVIGRVQAILRRALIIVTISLSEA